MEKPQMFYVIRKYHSSWKRNFARHI